MYKVDFNQPIKVHFIGIGGISMSGLAEILINRGFTVCGSDMNRSEITDRLISLGIKVIIGHHETNITEDIDLVVYTAAIKSSNVEYVQALEQHIPIIDRAELLGQIMSNYKYSIGIAGTHGKTTTTSMITHILMDAKKDPTISVGGILKLINGNIKVGNSEYFVTEACEYCNSFLKFHPYIAVILNVEEDHMDFFKDIKDIRKSFKQYLKNVPENGYVVINSDIEDYKELISDLKCNIITYGSDEAKSDWYAKNISFDKAGCGSYDLYQKGNKVETITLASTGTHNIYNSIAAIASIYALNIEVCKAKRPLQAFNGTNRRFQYKGSLKGVKIIDDYAHHPTAINATLDAAKKLDYNNLWVIFQPHTYSRTKAFLPNFAKSLAQADKIIITDIYAAREKDPGDIHSKDLVSEVKKIKEDCYYFSSFDEIEIFILENCIPDDLLITMGAGDVYIIGEDLLLG